METETEFINREISVWGFDYIDDLIDRGYSPTLITSSTERKWTWVYTVAPRADLCYTRVSVGTPVLTQAR